MLIEMVSPTGGYKVPLLIVPLSVIDAEPT
jgi:hypothetical protein